ncbi:uncharacterized protein N7484_009861 [Penicillium longicatenatum]|uniref:uncharacterized protein n=1 Tax=Penicillium longicatenatum TaxID=1561947 RepID=UPI00254712E8|nr:uncharacterized protein N7484_009861 [Penicillium longicatenatum]KAJ5636548.1 hypothetical protein N7484_009861 [Penicillium longicatenatum]
MGMNGPRIKNPLEDLQWETRLKGLESADYVLHVAFSTVAFSPMKYGVAPKFTCVLSMRASMSGRILDIKDPSEIPYCIWHSEHPFQTILRELKKALSQNDVSRGSRLPSKVHIAAEAREASLARSNIGSEAIYEYGMSNYLNFEIINDDNRSVNIDIPPIENDLDTPGLIDFLKLSNRMFMPRLRSIKSLSAASVEELRFNIKYLEDTHTAKVLYSLRSTTNRALFKDEPFKLTTAEQF